MDRFIVRGRLHHPHPFCACIARCIDVLFALTAMPDLPVEVWAHIMDMLAAQRRRAATAIQAHYNGFKTRIGPLRWILRYIRKGNLLQTRAAYHAHQLVCVSAIEHGHTYVGASRVVERC